MWIYSSDYILEISSKFSCCDHKLKLSKMEAIILPCLFILLTVPTPS
jgi:hypothetical protein